jgi:hypothetical protein
MNKSKLILFLIIIINLLTIVLLNNWGNDPMFNFGPNLSWIQGKYTQNHLTNYEQNNYNGYFYGIYFWIFKIKNLGFIPYKFYQIFQIALIIILILKIQKSNNNLLYFTALIFSTSILSGPRLEVLPITLILIVIYFLQNINNLNKIVCISIISLILSILPMLHPMAALQVFLIILWYFLNEITMRKYILISVFLSAIIFLVFNNFEIHRYLETYTIGHSSRELNSHSWQPFSTLKFLIFTPLIIIGFINIEIFSRQFLFIILSLFVAQLFGRSYYAIYSVTWLILFTKDTLIFEYTNKLKAKMNLFILFWTIILSSIRPLQAIENPKFFKTNYQIAKESHNLVVNYKKTHPSSNIWTSYFILPYLYDVENLRFYWDMTPILNGYGFIKKGDLFILTDNNDKLIVEDLLKHQGLSSMALPMKIISSPGILRTNLNRTDSINFKIYKAE